MLTCVPNACAVTDLQGNSEAQVTRNVVVEYDCALLTPVPPQQGDLKSVVLHKMSMRSTQNSYPIGMSSHSNTPYPETQRVRPAVLRAALSSIGRSVALGSWSFQATGQKGRSLSSTSSCGRATLAS